ncbi:MAG: ATP-binding protein [Selenomonadaceae bacterium]|nr:ATP-binding protein [Selenomonadaceae bacterium]
MNGQSTDAEWKEFPALLDKYDEMLSYIMEMAETCGVPMKRQMKLQLGFEEAVVNIISYAYLGQEPGNLWIRAWKQDGAFVIELKDGGSQFNPLLKEDALEEKPKSLEDAKIGGLGIAFMRRIFNEMSYDYKKEDGLFFNHLTLYLDISA